MKSCRNSTKLKPESKPLQQINSRKRHRSDEDSLCKSIEKSSKNERETPKAKRVMHSQTKDSPVLAKQNYLQEDVDKELQSFLTPAKDDQTDAEYDDVIDVSKSKMDENKKVSQYRFRNMMVTELPCLPLKSPLPELSWADSQDLWKAMVNKEMKYQCDNKYMIRHPDLQPRMRAILMDWMIEVCEVYTLHRETFYLAVDYIDRFLSRTENIRKTQLQLVGITALFIAAKLEEIYPPKLADFAYVTDGACTEDEILKLELLMLNKLKWALSPVTVNSWLNVYLQTAHLSFIANASNTFILPQYPQHTFVHVAQLTDLCILDMESLEFSSGVIAASALYHFSSCELATHVSGYEYKDLAKCIHWMAPFAMTVRDTGLQPVKEFAKVEKSDAHNIQTHSNDIAALDMVYERRSQHLTVCSSPTEIAGIITPPKSSQKPMIIDSSHAKRAGVGHC
uniref:G1/S-specific cyclin-E1-like n=1 Tax=Styela clava TaxID=7725 RepID=UPI001939E8A1|nr:G1/S-specific cyclin-E1-like [Styela clava]